MLDKTTIEIPIGFSRKLQLSNLGLTMTCIRSLTLVVLIFSLLLIQSDLVASELPLTHFSFSGRVLHEGIPAANDTIRIVNSFTTTTDSLFLITDPNGFYNYSGIGINPILSDIRMSAFPNPNPTHLVVDLASEYREKQISVNLYDLRGRRLDSGNRIPAGVYVVRLMSEGAHLASRKISFVNSLKRDAFVVSWRYQENNLNEANDIDETLVTFKISSEGYHSKNEIVSIDTENNIVNFDLQRNTHFRFRVFNIRGSEEISGGRVFVSGNGYCDTLQANGIGEYECEIPTEIDSLTIHPFGFDGYQNTAYSILNPTKVAVRGWIGEGFFLDGEQDTAKVYVANIPEISFIEIVPEIRVNDSFFRGTVNHIYHRVNDVRYILFTNTYNSNFTQPAPQHSLDQLRDAVSELFIAFDGGPADGIPLIGYSYQEMPYYDGADWFGRGGLLVDTSSGPHNSRSDIDRDGDIDETMAFINHYSGIGETFDEVFGGVVLHDYPNNSSIPNLIDNDARLTDFALDAIHTVMKRKSGTYDNIW